MTRRTTVLGLFRAAVGVSTLASVCSAAQECIKGVTVFEGEGDLTAKAEVAEACRSCRGAGAVLQHAPGEGGGPGRTACVVPDGRQQRSAPQALFMRAACGEGAGDLRNATGAEERCAACEGPDGMLALQFLPWTGEWRTLCAAGRGRALAAAAADPACAPKALELRGDYTAEADMAATCQKCLGSTARPQYVPLAANGGYTTCHVPDGRVERSQPQAVAVRKLCGEGIGDVRNATDASELCESCEGPKAVLTLHFLPWEGSFRTRCQKASAEMLSMVALDSSDPCNPKSLELSGDVTAEAAAAKTCQKCYGAEARLQYVPLAAQGGFTTCRAPDGRSERSQPQALAVRELCGEGVGDVREASGAVARCIACEGPKAVLELQFLPWTGANRTRCLAEPGPDARRLAAEAPTPEATVLLAAATKAALRGSVARRGSQ